MNSVHAFKKMPVGLESRHLLCLCSMCCQKWIAVSAPSLSCLLTQWEPRTSDRSCCDSLCMCLGPISHSSRGWIWSSVLETPKCPWGRRSHSVILVRCVFCEQVQGAVKELPRRQDTYTGSVYSLVGIGFFPSQSSHVIRAVERHLERIKPPHRRVFNPN